MIKCFCDKCAEEVVEPNMVVEAVGVKDARGVIITTWNKYVYALCNKCYGRFKRSNLDIVEFMKLPIEDLQIYDCMFEVGDEVITSTGEVGIITDICTCEKCKERGFYEPTVETKIGNDRIWLSDNDKRVNFASFYKIGDNVYGNIDEESLLYDIEWTNRQMRELTIRRRALAKQMKVLEECKKEQEKI